MRNAFDDPYATSLALREAERMGREFGDLLSVRQQAITNLMGGQTSARWNDLAENALKMSELVGIDRITGTDATKKLLDDLHGASRISGTVLGNLYSFHAGL